MESDIVRGELHATYLAIGAEELLLDMDGALSPSQKVRDYRPFARRHEEVVDLHERQVLVVAPAVLRARFIRRGHLLFERQRHIIQGRS